MSSNERRSRWGPEATKPHQQASKFAITGPMTIKQIEAFARQVRIDEISHKLQTNDIVPTDSYRRSPSPDPVYDQSGMRINTRHQRYRQRLEDERHSLVMTSVQTATNHLTATGAPMAMKPGRPIKDKVYIPSRDFPGINFIGQLLGPRGRSLTAMNEESGARIVLRGKGSVKEGKGRPSTRHTWNTDDQHELLHCLITADSQDKIDKAKKLVQDVIDSAICQPEHENERKRDQLRALAVINGTFRDDEARAAPFEGFVAPSVKCHTCHGWGHIPRDCLSARRAGESFHKVPPWRLGKTSGGGTESKEDADYNQLIRELGMAK